MIDLFVRITTFRPEAFLLSCMSFYRSGTDPGKRKGPADENGAFACHMDLQLSRNTPDPGA